MGTSNPAGNGGGLQFSQRLVLALSGAGLAIGAFGVLSYVRVIATIDDPAVRSAVTSSFVGLILTAAISLVLVAVTVGSNTAITLELLAQKARRIENGDMDVDLSTTRGDEFGTLANSLASMRDSLQDRIEEVEANRREIEQRNEAIERTAEHYREVLAAVTSGDLSRRANTDSEIDALSEIGEAINLTAETLEEATGNIATQMEQLSANAEEVAASTQELGETSERAATVGQEGRSAAREAIAEMDEVEAETDAVVQRIERLEAEMEDINDILQLIGQVAQKTNILAVNARIESSRGGESGEGYSVVAEEIRELAEETKGAAEEVEGRLTSLREQVEETGVDVRDTQQRVDRASQAVEGTVSALDDVAALADTVDENVKNIGQATDDQAQSVQEVADQVDSLMEIDAEARGGDRDAGVTGGIEGASTRTLDASERESVTRN